MSILRPNRRKDRNKDPRGLLFMEFVKTYPCVVCWGFPGIFHPPGTCQVYWDFEKAHGNPSQSYGPTEFAHIDGNAAAKASNMCGIPLCVFHHRGDCKDSHENLKKRFGAHWGIDVHAIIRRLVEEFDRTHAE